MKARGRARIPPAPRMASSRSLLRPAPGATGFHRQSSPPHRPGRHQRRQGRRVPRRRQATLRHRLLVPQPRDQQVLCYKNGLAQGKHRLEIVAPGRRTRSRPARGSIWTPSSGRPPRGTAASAQGGGPTETQRVIFGYVGRKDYVDSSGYVWRPATEFILRLGTLADLVPSPSGRSRNSKRWPARPTPNFIATASTAAISPPTSPWRPHRPITCG